MFGTQSSYFKKISDNVGNNFKVFVDKPKAAGYDLGSGIENLPKIIQDGVNNFPNKIKETDYKLRSGIEQFKATTSNRISDNIKNFSKNLDNYTAESNRNLANLQYKVDELKNKAKKSFSSMLPISYNRTNGGRRRKKRGGYVSNTPLNNIASKASPYNGVKTAQPHNWVGGKSRRSYRKNKTRRNKTRRMRR